MSSHALLSPSSAHRWLNCPRAPRLEATLPQRTSVYAVEGTTAHSTCEALAKKKFKKIKTADYNKIVKRLKTHKSWDDEMLQTAEIYVEHLEELAMKFNNEPYIAFEVKVDISDYVPEAYGYCDSIMISDDTLIITDYKHGKGVHVSPQENPQLMLYALGAVKLYRNIFGSSIKKVQIYIDQPRIKSYEGWECTIEELTTWGENIKPKAQMAYMGFGDFNAGEWCRFCRANGICKAQAEQQLNSVEIKDILEPEEISQVLQRGETLINWYEAVKAQALNSMLSGEKIPGFKLVESRSSRIWKDQDKALETLQENGIDKAIIYDNVPKTLSQLEKLIGASKFDELVGTYVEKPPGRPTLAPQTDKRQEISSAFIDFKMIES